MIRRALLAAMALCACSRSTSEEKRPPEAPASARLAASAPVADDCTQVFLPPSGAEPLCDEHVMGSGMEIHWRSYASKEPQAALEARYRASAGRCGYALVTKPPQLSVSHGSMRLEVFDAGAKGYPSCSASPKSDHVTVIVISEKHDRPRVER
ncbi:MAG: hypothetical protein JST00_40730 [Deltaproteobacteria bacterium]|nr:hypothetical protein [Deltaproteobacteria bacterium]